MPPVASNRLPLVGPTSVIPRAAAVRSSARAVEGLVQPEVWTMYDTYIISANAVPPAPAAVNFADVPGQIPFFTAGRTAANAGFPITSMTTNSGYVDFPFKAYGIGVEVWCETDTSFVQTLVQNACLVLQFATDTKYVAPLSDLPGGGGPVSAVADGTSVTNGQPTIQARSLWKDYILFRAKETPFNVTINIGGSASAGALAKINGMTALTNDDQAGIRVKFWGYRGKSLITGAPYRGA